MALKTAHIGPRTGLLWNQNEQKKRKHSTLFSLPLKPNTILSSQPRLLPPATSIHATLMGSKSMFFHISSACFTAYVLTCYLLGMLLLLCYISQPLNSDKLKGMNKKWSYTICFSVCLDSSRKKIHLIHFILWSWSSTSWFNIVSSFLSLVETVHVVELMRLMHVNKSR